MNSTQEQQRENYISFDAVSPLPPNKRDFLTTPINPDVPHWSILTALGLWFLSVALIIVASVIAVGGYLLFNYFSAGIEPNQANPIKDPIAIIVNLVAILPAHLLTIVAAWSLLTRNGKQSFWQTLGWNFDKFFGYFGFLICFAITVILFAIGITIISISGEQENDLVRMLQSSRTAVYLTALMATFTAPLAEEVIYRGVLYPAFRLKLGAPAAILFVTLLFAAVHVPQYVEFDKMQNLSNYGTISVIIILSLTLTLIRAQTGSLLPCFVIHTIFNGIQSLILIAAPYLPKTLAPDEPNVSSVLQFFR